MTAIDKLKQRKPSRKAVAPPSIDDSPSVIEPNPRVTAEPSPAPAAQQEPLMTLSFKVPHSMGLEDKELAYRAFGTTHGAKAAALDANV